MSSTNDAGSKFLYMNITPLRDYIDRIGAECLNFRRFIVKDIKGHYYTEKAIIKIVDNEVYCSNADYAPTVEEATLIKGALADFKGWPNSIAATEANYQELVSEVGREGLFPMWSWKNKDTITMVQQRVLFENGDKVYIPWSFWSDGLWRKMEPDGDLPFWKPRHKKSTSIMVHEGAKAARAAQQIVDSKEDHPWLETLSRYDHWGIIGGALAPHRADYSELSFEKPTEVVYVCDNDFPGVSVLQKFSKNWGKSCFGIRFGDDFPQSWDIADPIPESMFAVDEEGKRRFIGQTLDKFIRPATRATKLINIPGVKKSVAELTREFTEEWMHCVHPECYIHKNWPQNLWSGDEFNNLVRPYSDVDGTARLLKEVESSKVEKLDYNPGKLPGIYSDEGKLIVNNHYPSGIKPEKGDFSIWIEYMERMIPLKIDREELYKWIATLINRPDIRMNYSVLLISETQGVGKTTLGEKILCPIIGKHNCSFPNEKMISESQFNGWIAHKRLAVINEVYAGQSKRAYNDLKTIIADASVKINEKYTTPYEITNWIHILASSNSMAPLKFDKEDRRWLVPAVTEEKDSDPNVRRAYWERLNAWLKNGGGLGKIMYWAELYIKDNGPVLPGQEAPKTSLKEEVALNGFTDAQLFIYRTLAKLKDKYEEIRAGENPPEDIRKRHFYIFDRDLQTLIQDDFYGTRERATFLDKVLTLRRVAKNVGLFVSPRNIGLREWDIGPDAARIISDDPRVNGKTLREIADLGIDHKEHIMSVATIRNTYSEM